MRKTKKLLALTLAALMVMEGLTGCGGAQTGSSDQAAGSSQSEVVEKAEKAQKTEKSEGKVITFGTHQSGIPSNGVLQDLALQFEAETGIKVDFQVSPDAQWRDLLKVKLDAGEAPDIFCVDADPLSLYSRIRPDENAVDLSNEEFTDRMADYAKECVSYEGKVYGIRFAEQKLNFYNYNKKIFADLGLTVPTNYEEFKNVCQKIKDAGIVPVFEATQSGWHQVTPLFLSGAFYESQEPGLYEALNNNTKNIKDVKLLLTVLKQMNEFAQLGFYGEDYLSNTYEASSVEFGTGKVAMNLAAPGFAVSEQEKYPELKDQIGIFLIPFGDSDVLGINPSSAAYFANAKSKNKEEALEFLRFLARPENLQYRQDNNPEELGLCWPEIAPEYPAEFTEYINSLKSGTVMQVGVKYIDPQWMDTGKDIEAMYTGALTPEQVVENIAKRRDEQAKLQKDPAWQ